MIRISRQAIQKFLDRPRRDIRFYVKKSAEWVEEKRRSLPVRPPIWKRLKLHNKKCLLLGIRRKRFGFFNDTGTGKTRLGLALAAYFNAEGGARTLVLVPTRPVKGEWEEEARKLKLPILILRGSSAQKWRQLEESDVPIVVESGPGLVRMVCVKAPRTRGKKGQRLKPDRKLVGRLRELFQGLITDEGMIMGLANKTSLPWRICRQLIKDVEVPHFQLTGTPFGRDPTLLWSQLYLIDGGHTLGQTLTLFRAAFFSQSENYWGGFDYKFRKRQMPLLNRFLAHSSIRFEADQADLPRCSEIVKKVSLGEDAEGYYQKAKERIMAAHGNYREMKNAFLRMRQISSGFVGFHDDELGEKAQFEFPVNPKLEALMATVQSIRPEHKVIIFYDFTVSGLRIMEELRRAKIKAVHLYGKSKDVEKARAQFAGDHQVLVLQNQFGVGLNLQVARYGLFFEAPVSVIIRKQAIRRFVRQYSLHQTVFLYDFVMADTVDEQVLSFHRQGEDLFKAIVQGKVKPK